MPMDLREMANFIKIVELGSLSRAAEVLHIGQPALGFQVRNLETALQQQLLVRHSRGVEPTEAGLLLVEHARVILDEIAKAKRAIAELGEPSGSVSLGMTASANSLLLADLYQRASQQYPRLKLNVLEALSGALTEKLAAGEIELACLYSGQELKNVVRERLIDDEWVFVSATAKRPPRDEITFRELSAYPLIVPSRISGMRVRLDEAARQKGLKLTIALEVQSESLMRRLIDQGVGHTVLPSVSVRNSYDRSSLHIARIVEPSFPSTMCLIYPERPTLSQGAAAVRRLLLELAEQYRSANLGLMAKIA
jgi:LysR family nitrogen assimilation transcriptional regulator